MNLSSLYDRYQGIGRLYKYPEFSEPISTEQKILHIYLVYLYFNIFYDPAAHMSPSFYIHDLWKMAKDEQGLDPYIKQYFSTVAITPDLEKLKVLMSRHALHTLVTRSVIDVIFAIYGDSPIELEGIHMYRPYLSDEGYPVIELSDWQTDLNTTSLNITKTDKLNLKFYAAMNLSDEYLFKVRDTALPLELSTFSFDTDNIPFQNKVAKLINFYTLLYPLYQKNTASYSLKYEESGFVRSALYSQNLYYYDINHKKECIEEKRLVDYIANYFNKDGNIPSKTLHDIFFSIYEKSGRFVAMEAEDDTIEEIDEPDSSFFGSKEEESDDENEENPENEKDDSDEFSDDENSDSPIEMDNDNIESEQAGGSILTFLSGTDNANDFLFKLSVLEKCRELTNNPSAISPENLAQFRNWCRLFLFTTVVENTKSILQQLKIADVKEFQK